MLVSSFVMMCVDDVGDDFVCAYSRLRDGLFVSTTVSKTRGLIGSDLHKFI